MKYPTLLLKISVLLILLIAGAIAALISNVLLRLDLLDFSLRLPLAFLSGYAAALAGLWILPRILSNNQLLSKSETDPATPFYTSLKTFRFFSEIDIGLVVVGVVVAAGMLLFVGFSAMAFIPIESFIMSLLLSPTIRKGGLPRLFEKTFRLALIIALLLFLLGFILDTSFPSEHTLFSVIQAII